MITCPKCQTPNPDSASTCLACGAGFAGEQFAAALDRAQAQPAATPAPAASAAEPGGGESYDPLAGIGPGLPDAAAAQAEINQFVAEQRARKRKKATIWIVLLVIGVAVAVFFAMRSAQRKAKEQEIASFYLEFRKVDDGPMADFYRCAVRAKHLDVRLAKDNLMLTDGLQKAYENFPKTQPAHITKKCLPLIDQAIAGLGELKLPEGMSGPIAGLKRTMEKSKDIFAAYVEKLAARADQTANEKTLLEASAAIHTEDPNQVTQAVGYTMVLECAVPELEKMFKKVTKLPDAQPLVEYMHEQCKDNAKGFSDKLRKDCLGKLTELGKDAKRPQIYRTLSSKMSGDDRDRMALDYCFKRANRGFFDDDIVAIGKSWVDYRTERGKVLDEVGKHKKE